MRVYADRRTGKSMEEGIHMIREHRGPGGPVPPHERKALIRIEFDED